MCFEMESRYLLALVAETVGAGFHAAGFDVYGAVASGGVFAVVLVGGGANRDGCAVRDALCAFEGLALPVGCAVMQLLGGLCGCGCGHCCEEG